jgi:hypothetical protein
VLACAFAVLALAQSVTIYLVPFLIGALFTMVAVGTVGLLAGAASLLACMKRHSATSLLGLTLVVATFVGWMYVPTRELALLTTFHVLRGRYEHGASQLRRGLVPDCIGTGACMTDPRAPGYLVFPLGGLLSSWIGIVYAPGGKINEHLGDGNAFASAARCDPAPLHGSFFVCGFA